MDIGVAMPNTFPGAPSQNLIEWAAEADRAGFSSVATLDRLVFDNHEGLTTLAAAAAVTERAKLMTSVVVAPLHANTALLAKQAATVDRLSGGRLVLGVAAGARPDDFSNSKVEPKGRGKRLAAQISELRAIWSGEPRGFAGAIGPAPATEGGPPVVLGGHSLAAIDRAARIGDGWISGGGGAGMFAQSAPAFRNAWREHGRESEPRVFSLAYFSLGPRAEELASAYLTNYYAFAPPYAQIVLRNAGAGEAKLRQMLADFDNAGCDEVLLVPCSPDLGQLKELRALLGY